MPAPFSTAAEDKRSIRAGGNNQNLILFSRGKAISGAPNISGSNQLPNPPINTGITKKKIIRNACAVTIVLYNWSLPKNEPGCLNSIRINKLIAAPIIPAQTPKMKYKVPMSLWLVEYSQRILHIYIISRGTSGKHKVDIYKMLEPLRFIFDTQLIVTLDLLNIVEKIMFK